MNWRMSRIVRTVTDFLIVPIIVYGAYLIIHGHLSPGGGFQGGAVIASSTALLIIAHGSLREHKKDFSTIESLGLTMFILIALLGIGSTMFYNFLAGTGGLFGAVIPEGVNPGYINTGGTVPLMNIFVGVKVAASLSLIIWIMAKQTFSTESEKQEVKD